jgi:predicted HicB family RNase H-like nuclease
MTDTIRYKGYVGSVHFDSQDRLFHGKVLGIRDRVLFEGRSVEELEQGFREAVDDYLEWCHEENREPEKPFSGVFTVRVTPDLHCAVWIAAQRNGTSVARFVRRVLESSTGYRCEAPEDVGASDQQVPLRFTHPTVVFGWYDGRGCLRLGVQG